MVGKLDILFWISYILLWGAVIAQGGLILVLGRAYSRHLDRTMEGRAEKHGPDVGDKVPSKPDVVLAAERPSLMVFLASGCGPCRTALPVISWVADRYATAVSVIVIVSGANIDGDESVEVSVGEFARVVRDTEGSLAQAWGVGMWPFVVAIDNSRVVVGKRARAQLQDFEVLLKELNARLRLVGGASSKQ